jgi:hypothetical protein
MGKRGNTVADRQTAATVRALAMCPEKPFVDGRGGM